MSVPNILQVLADEFIRECDSKWTGPVDSDTKTLVYGNVRGFAGFVNERTKPNLEEALEAPDSDFEHARRILENHFSPEFIDRFFQLLEQGVRFEKLVSEIERRQV